MTKERYSHNSIKVKNVDKAKTKIQIIQGNRNNLTSESQKSFGALTNRSKHENGIFKKSYETDSFNMRFESPRKAKRSSSESMVHRPTKILTTSSNDTARSILRNDSSLSNEKKFKSKSSRNINSSDGKVIKEFIKNHNTIRVYQSMPKSSMPPLHITNQEEVKKKFFDDNIPPVLQFKAQPNVVQNILIKHKKTSYHHFFKAKHILDHIKSKFSGGIISYYEANFGKKITSADCVDIIGKYLTENKIDGELMVNFAPGLTCSGRITSYNTQLNNPETRKFVIWINDGEENQFLRKKGIVSLCDHEIGLQVWYSDRKKYGLRPLNSLELLRTEEGLAALHTLMNANLKYLYLPALLYYLACMADSMTFEQLFNHLGMYIEKPEERWKLVTRVKRGISNPYEIGAYSRDQSYFEGAIDILENLDYIDFKLLISGKICLDELSLIAKHSKFNNLKIPKFMHNLSKYKERLRKIGIANGIIDSKDFSLSSLLDNSDDDQDSTQSFLLTDKIYNHRELFKLNMKCNQLSTNEIKKYIIDVIVKNTKNTPVIKPSGIKESSSSLCTLL